MATMEQVEQLRKRANVSYQDAKEALEACNSDILDALIYLEKQGMVTPPQEGGRYSTQRQSTPPKNPAPTPKTDEESISTLIKKLLYWVMSWVRKGNRNYFVVQREDEHVFSIPITVLLLIISVTFWLSSILLLCGLIFGFRYSFSGPDINPSSPNNTPYSGHSSTKKEPHDE